MSTSDWLSKAPCKGIPTAWFFSSNPDHVRKTDELCNSCPFTEPCLEYGLKVTKEANRDAPRHRESLLLGKWGGQSEWRIKQARKKKNEQIHKQLAS